MTTYTLTGLAVTFGDEDADTAVPVSLNILVEDATSVVSYGNPTFPPGSELFPTVDVDYSDVLGVSISGGATFDTAGVVAMEALFGFVLTADGETIVLTLFDAVAEVDYIFLIDGFIPEAFGNVTDFNAMSDAILGGGLITAPDPYAPNTDFTVSGLNTVNETEDDVFFGTNADDKVDLNVGADVMYGGAGEDKLTGGKGSDEIYGGGGADVLRGETGKDEIYGGFGADKVIGAEGRDKLYGDQGKDIIDGGKGNDVLFGGDGADTFLFRFNRDEGTDRIKDWEDGTDVIEFKGGNFADLTIEQSFNNVKVTWANGEIVIEGALAADITIDDFVFG